MKEAALPPRPEGRGFRAEFAMTLAYGVLIYLIIATGFAPIVGKLILERVCRDRGEPWSTAHTLTLVVVSLMWPVLVVLALIEWLIHKREK
jgi:hypothetical protein